MTSYWHQFQDHGFCQGLVRTSKDGFAGSGRGAGSAHLTTARFTPADILEPLSGFRLVRKHLKEFSKTVRAVR